MKKIACYSAAIILAAVVLGPEISAEAQVRGGRVGVGRGFGRGRWYHPYGVRYGYGGWGGGWSQGPSTVAEGYGRGMADVIRAQGEYDKAAAQARLSNEEARAKHIENNKKAADTYWEMKDNHRRYKEEQRRRKQERSQQNRERLETARIASKFRGLGPDDFDPVTAKIHWPELLQQPAFAKSRKKLEVLFEHRVLTGGATGEENGNDIKSATEALRAELKKQIRQIPAAEYIAARKFIDGLAYEGRS